MKKTMMTALVLVMAIVAQAQVKIAPKMAKGDKYVYVTEAKTDAAGQVSFAMTGENVYEVVEATADGYVLNVTNTKLESSTTDNPIVRIMLAAEEVMKNQTIQLVTDKDGRPTGIKNFDELRKNVSTSMDQWITEFYKAYPQVLQMVPQEKLKAQLQANLTEEFCLKTFTSPNSVFCLNGLTIQNMSQDTYTDAQGLKMKRMYFVSNGGKSVLTSSKTDMTADELKAMIIKQVEENAPEQAEMIKQNIDAVMASGAMKIEGTEKTQYELQDNGWVKTIESNTETNSMGQSLKTTVTVKVKE